MMSKVWMLSLCLLCVGSVWGTVRYQRHIAPGYWACKELDIQVSWEQSTVTCGREVFVPGYRF